MHHLEPRQLLSAASPIEPTADEQYMLQLVNRARSEPAAETQRLRAVARTDPAVRQMVRRWPLDRFAAVMDGYDSLPPLAFNTRLIEAARDRNAEMLATNDQRHAPPGFISNAEIARADDGDAYYDTGNGAWSWGENLFAYSRNVRATRIADYVDYFHAGLMIDWGNPDFGHLRNLMAPGPGAGTTDGQRPYREIGIGLLVGAEPTTAPPSNPANPLNAGLNVGPVLVTQEFGYREGPAFLTGAVYRDADRDDFYTPGEGLGGVTITAIGLSGEGTYTAATWGSGGYSLALPAGSYRVTIAGPDAPTRTRDITISQDNVGWDVAYDVALADIPVPADYDGDGKVDPAVYRPGTGEWFIHQSRDGARVLVLGQDENDIPVPADYDGDDKADPAIYRSTTGQWVLLQSSAGARTVTLVANPSVSDLPVPADYDGDGKADPAIYRASRGQWLLARPGGATRRLRLGRAGVDVPVPGDYDGDGRAEPTVFRPSTGEWLIAGGAGASRRVATLGQAGTDVPTPADFDGDGRTDPAVIRPATGEWLGVGSSVGPWSSRIDAASPVRPIAGDYDGDGRAETAVFRTGDASWIGAGTAAAFPFGAAGPGPSTAQLLSLTLARFGTGAGATAVSTPQPAPIAGGTRASRR